MSEQNFFLYDQLFEVNKNAVAKLTNAELIELMTMLRKLDREGMDLIFVLIRVHSLRSNEGKVFDIPYKGEKLTDQTNTDGYESPFGKKDYDIKFDVRNFPVVLQRILLTFCKRHIASVEETKNRNESE
jgi:hypothetical protein